MYKALLIKVNVWIQNDIWYLFFFIFKIFVKFYSWILSLFPGVNSEVIASLPAYNSPKVTVSAPYLSSYQNVSSSNSDHSGNSTMTSCKFFQHWYGNFRVPFIITERQSFNYTTKHTLNSMYGSPAILIIRIS